MGGPRTSIFLRQKKFQFVLVAAVVVFLIVLFPNLYDSGECTTRTYCLTGLFVSSSHFPNPKRVCVCVCVFGKMIDPYRTWPCPLLQPACGKVWFILDWNINASAPFQDACDGDNPNKSHTRLHLQERASIRSEPLCQRTPTTYVAFWLEM